MKFEEEKQMIANFSVPSLHTERHDQQELQKRHSEIHTMKRKCRAPEKWRKKSEKKYTSEIGSSRLGEFKRSKYR